MPECNGLRKCSGYLELLLFTVEHLLGVSTINDDNGVLSQYLLLCIENIP